MRIRTLLLYLIGDRQVILDLAADRRALWVGLLFVLSAGFAREYDGEDLLHEPWHLLIPLGASLCSGSLLFVVACGKVFFRRDDRPPFWPAYRSFLTLFWLTAPLAWLYAIPYERFFSEVGAIQANLLTLALVAFWRVVLMVRVVSVITDLHWASSLPLVLLFADGVALTAVSVMPIPIITGMGGIRHSAAERWINGIAMVIRIFGGLSIFIWAIGALASWIVSRPTWKVPIAEGAAAPAKSIWAVVGASLLVWIPIMPFTQREQQLRWQVERELRAGRIAEGLDFMSAHSPSDFPPHWEPPPRVGYREKRPHILDVVEFLQDHVVANWVRERYVEAFRRFMGEEYAFYDPDECRRGTDLKRAALIISQIPEGPAIAAEHRKAIQDALREGITSFDAEERKSLELILRTAREFKQ